MTCWTRDGDDVVLKVYLQPRASRSRVVGIHGECLKIAVTAAPVDGGANRELGRLLAGLFRVSRSAVHIEKGLASRHKRVRIYGVADVPACVRQGGLE